MHTSLVLCGNTDSSHPGEGFDPLNYGWKDMNGYYAPDWFSGPAIPDHMFEEPVDNSCSEEHENGELDLATEFDDADGSGSDLPLSDGSKSETEV